MQHKSYPAPVLARTILAGCAHARVRLDAVGDAGPDVGDDLGVLFDEQGQAYVLVGPGTARPGGTVHIECRTAEEGLGVLHLAGVIGSQAAVTNEPQVLENVFRQRPEWEREGRARYGQPDGIRILNVCLDEICVVVPATGRYPERVIRVDPLLYAMASPDAWLVGAPRLARWLETRCQRDLCTIADWFAEGGIPWVDAVSVDEVDAEYLVLVGLGPDGVVRVMIPFTAALGCPCDVARWVENVAAELR